MGLLHQLLIILLASALAVATTTMHPLSEEFIDYINSKQTTWRAGRNFPSNTPLEDLKKLADVYPDVDVHSLPRIKYDAAVIEQYPESFHPNEKWPYCPSLFEIRDQGSCTSSWALAAVAVMTDRMCIHSKGKKQFHFSAEDLISCCTNCGGCGKGEVSQAWEYWFKNGIVSGGNYNSNQGCRPYSIPPCEHRLTSSGESENELICGKNVETPKCEKTCDENYVSAYEEDKIYGKKIYSIEANEHNMKAELMNNGPVEATFWIYTDFYNYKYGVYQHTGGDLVGQLAVKLMGWGVENGVKYWLAANSWNSEWGDRGFFKILRGEYHLNITDNIRTGFPEIKK